jgi:hypothetical protein
MEAVTLSVSWPPRRILQITFLDHVIVGQAMVSGRGFFSFRQAGLCETPLRRAERWGRGCLPANSGSCAQMRLRGHHLGTAAALEGRKYSDAAAAGVADRHNAVFDGDAALALALFT